MYRACIIGNPESVWTREYVKKIHLEDNHKVYILSFDEISDTALVEYNNLGVEVVELGTEKGIKGKLQKTFNLIKFAILHARNNKFDILEIQSVPHSFQVKVIYCISMIMNTKLLVSFWGSDILAINKTKAKRLKGVLCKSDYINLGTQNMYDVFSSYYGHSFDKKIISARFGSLAFSEINKVKQNYSNDECKKIMGFNANKKIIAVGYNGKPEQQHINAIEQLSLLSVKDKQKIQIVIHMGYGYQKEYADMVEEAAKKSGIEYSLLLDMLDLSQIAFLRVATDIFLHAQISDALSGTIRECLYSGTMIINPAWIYYHEFDELGIEYVKYSTFSELPDLMSDIINNRITINTESNVKTVYDQYSWDVVKCDWKKVFNNGAY